MYIELYNTSHELKLKEDKFLFEINSILLIDNYNVPIFTTALFTKI